MDTEDIKRLLEAVASGGVCVEDAVRNLSTMPFLRMDDVTHDTHRHLRRGVTEAIYGESKTTDQVCSAISAVVAAGSNCVVTRIGGDKATQVIGRFPELAGDGRLTFDGLAGMLLLRLRAVTPCGRGNVVVVTAGASDARTAEEAALTLEMAGDSVIRIRDVGVAGIHRLAPHLDTIRSAAVVIVVAGMEGALPGIVAGLGPAPVIGVPTSVGYGTSFGGLAALLSMLNSCAGGITVVNIDNGYGAALAAHLMNSDRPVAPGVGQ